METLCILKDNQGDLVGEALMDIDPSRNFIATGKLVRENIPEEDKKLIYYITASVDSANVPLIEEAIELDKLLEYSIYIPRLEKSYPIQGMFLWGDKIRFMIYGDIATDFEKL